MLKGKKYNGKILNIAVLLIVLLSIINCSKEDNTPPIPTGQSKQYTIFHTNLSDLTGTVNFIENTNGSTTISLQLDNIIKDVNYPVRLRGNTANIGGGIVVNLGSINGQDGTSNTTLSKLANGNDVSYEQLAEFRGYIAIEGDNENIGLLLAYTDLGPNEFTGRNVTYDLLSPDGAVDAQVKLQERKKGDTALTVNVFDIGEVNELPCSLHVLQVNSTEEYIHQLSPVTSKQNGFSFNELTEIDGVEITYDDVLQLNAYIEVSNESNPNSFFSKGAVGSN